MYNTLIQLYSTFNMKDIEYDTDFYNEMIRNPDFYGLNYSSYKILTFKFCIIFNLS